MSFLLIGFVAALVAALLEFSLDVAFGSSFLFVERARLTEIASPTVIGLLAFAAIEEIVKFGMLRKMIATRPSTPIRSALLFGAGFGATELVLASAKFSEAGVSALAGILLVHIGTALLYGYTIGKRSAGHIFALALLSGVILHFLYNTLLA